VLLVLTELVVLLVLQAHREKQAQQVRQAQLVLKVLPVLKERLVELQDHQVLQVPAEPQGFQVLLVKLAQPV
jgi:hypothetical protein